MKRISAFVVALVLTLSLTSCGSKDVDTEIQPDSEPTATDQPVSPTNDISSSADTHIVVLSSVQSEDGSFTHAAMIDGTPAPEFDYVWHADPGEVHSDVKNAPAEYFTGTAPETDAIAYIAHDIRYYPELPESGFVRVQYDDNQEWAYYYTDGENKDFIFSTLPIQGSGFPNAMMHSAADAYENAVLHISQTGTYILEGEWHGQVWIDLGDRDETFMDERAKVTVVLNGVDVTCSVAPALVFYSVYECDNGWSERSDYGYAVDTSNAGAVTVIADGTVNNFSGTNVFRMLKTKYKEEEEQFAHSNSVRLQKKMRKLDGTYYSFVTMNVEGGTKGTGVLNIKADYEGLDTELHLTVNGGNIHIQAGDDGINVNEDKVSVFTMNGGSLHILAGLGNEGDGVDSNGYLIVNGGTVIAMAKPQSDSGLDSDCGTYIFGGTVVALGSTMDWAESDDDGAPGDQAAMNLQFSAAQSADEAIIVTDTDGKVIFAYDPDKDETTGANARSYQGAIISSPDILVGGTYYLYVGGDVYGRETMGIFDPATISGFTEEAIQQCYASTGTLGGMGGFGGMMPFGGRGEPGQPPESAGSPNGFERPNSMIEKADGNGEMEFYMEDRVNGFRCVTDYSR